jgi:hypothetical protein
MSVVASQVFMQIRAEVCPSHFAISSPHNITSAVTSPPAIHHLHLLLLVIFFIQGSLIFP